MNSFEPQSQESLKRRFEDNNNTSQQQSTLIPPKPISKNLINYSNSSSGSGSGAGRFSGFGLNVEDDMVSTVVPPVTVVLEGRSICQRISLDKHGSYESLAMALRQMFVDGAADAQITKDFDLSNAIPGHLIAYEDMENDLLLAGDLTWKDFVRVAKRIRILPVKGNTRKGIIRNE